MASKNEKKTPTSDRGLTSFGDEAVINAGIDYLTVTSPLDSVGEHMYDYYKSQRVRFDYQNIQKDWSFYGYQGLRCAEFAWGYNERWGYLLRVSGPAAATAFMTVGGWGPDVRTTRIDLQITVDLGDKRQALAAKAYQEIPVIEQNKRNYAYWVNKKGGQTLYVGKRTSSRFGRLYDKGAQSGESEPLKLWRYEVEYKKPLASEVTKALAEKVMEPHGKERGLLADNLEHTILYEVVEFFDARGVKVPVSTEGRPLMYGCGVVKVDQNTSTRLQWLRSQVSPTINDLVARGHRDDVMDALGLS